MRTILSVCGLLIWSLPIARAQEAPRFDPSVTYRVPRGGAPARGPQDAPITIVEFSDFACPYCRRAQSTLDSLERLYPGQIRLVFRYSPLDMEDGTLTAEACAAADAQGRFWPMHDRIFATGGRVSRAELEGFAHELGLDIGRFRRDLDGRHFLDAVRADWEIAQRLRATSTPMFFVNGRPVKGAKPLGVFVATVERELTRARSLVARGVAPERLYEALTKDGRQRAELGEPLVEKRSQLEASLVYRTGLGLPGHSLGPDDALVTVVEVSDFECPYCRTAQPAIKAMRAEYPDDVRIVYRHFPLYFHKNAQLAAEAAVAAAAQSRFWPMHDRIFANQDRLTREDLERYAEEVGLDMDEFRAALDDRRYHELVAADRAAVTALGVRGTPTLFVNGTPMYGAKSYEDIKHDYLEPKLAQARAMVANGVSRSEVYATIMRTATHVEVGAEGRVDRGRANSVRGLQTQLDEYDVRTAILRACRVRDKHLAEKLYVGLEDPENRKRVRAACRPHGVDLVEN